MDAEKVERRIRELLAYGHELDRQDAEYSRKGAWTTSARHLLGLLVADREHVYRQAVEPPENDEYNIDFYFRNVLHHVEMFHQDFAAGLISTLLDSATAAVFDDFLDHAEHYLEGARVQPAGVIAGVAFEDTMRRLCSKVGVGAPQDPIEQLIIGLEKAKHLTSLKAKRARAAGELRTRATHANWDKFTESDVRSTIDFTRELIGKLES